MQGCVSVWRGELASSFTSTSRLRLKGNGIFFSQSKGPMSTVPLGWVFVFNHECIQLTWVGGPGRAEGSPQLLFISARAWGVRDGAGGRTLPTESSRDMLWGTILTQLYSPKQVPKAITHRYGSSEIPLIKPFLQTTVNIHQKGK